MKRKNIFIIGIAVFAMLLGGCDTNAKEQNKNDLEITESTTISTSDSNTEQVSEEVTLNEEQEKFYEGFKMQDDTLPQFEEIKNGDDIAVINTNMGTIKVRFFPEKAPKAVENFLTHAKDGYYNGIIFHRVINNFMIQGGDPEGTGMGGESIWKEVFENEVSPNLRNFRGALSMANAGPDTNGSQFYIVQTPPGDANLQAMLKELEEGKDQSIDPSNPSNPLKFGDIYPQVVIDKYKEIGGYPSLDFGYTVFGQVYEGMDVVDKIAAVKTGEGDKPVDDVIIENIEVGKYEG